ncbi:antiviral RADAR system adenosine triphosphatase RdrA [Aeromonas veronii]|uniref:antiviral RADAR system adenosine triphosphatase RdrA n=1 Tax=Aeromonas veronii TaxID=654 RepID=UPI003D20FCED
MSQNKRYIPLNAGESAVLPDANTLLPRNEVYEPLAQMIIDAVNKAEAAKSSSLNDLREHNAISIDGERGTGKTAVLVNLKGYLDQEKHKHILSKVHILDPVDPTLLENGESLFLHIIVAAVLHDKDVKEQQRNKPDKARSLNQTLEKLAQSLESVETQQDRYGMDKVRAMFSNKQLADCVQDFFREVLGLLGKQLLILPIDDVDTSLNRAFENLEIVRRYLATPYVLPIVCGDRKLYNDVTWRDFHGRLTKDSSYRRQEAYKKAVELAAEYQRKILPFPRRLTMPKVSSYWQWGAVGGEAADTRITLGNADDAMPLANFISWLDIFLTGPVNGSEGSRLSLPIPSMRALSQLIKHCHGLIPELPEAIRTAKSELEVRRIWQMPTTPLAVMAAFHLKYQTLSQTSRPDHADAYKEFNEKLKSSPAVEHAYGNSKQGEDSKGRVKKNELPKKLAEYFCFEPKGGAAYLILLAKLHWQNRGDSPSSLNRSILDTPLFQPLEHAEATFELFDKTDDLSAWPTLLKDRMPEEWLAGIKELETILPYPVAEVGVNSSKRWDYIKEIGDLGINDQGEDKKRKAGFLIALLAQHNFYTNAKQTMLLNIGRVFELLIASIAGPLSVEDINAIIGRAPFFSTAALAPTKTITIDETDDNDGGIKGNQAEEQTVSPLVVKLHEEIKTWRSNHHVDQIDLSPWLVYKVFNKVFSQVASNEKVPNGMKNIGTAMKMVANTFYATWFAFGSFEKGELFGLPNVVATTNVNPENLKNYENHDQFKTNVLPFTPTLKQNSNKDEDYNNKTGFGEKCRVVSYVLAHHPLKKWIDEVIALTFLISDKKAQEYIRKQLSISEEVEITKDTIKSKAKLKKNKDKLDQIYEHMKKNFGANVEIVMTFKTVCNEVAKEATQKSPTNMRATNNQTSVVNIQPQPEVQQPEQNQPPTETTQPERLSADQEQDKGSE